MVSRPRDPRLNQPRASGFGDSTPRARCTLGVVSPARMQSSTEDTRAEPCGRLAGSRTTRRAFRWRDISSRVADDLKKKKAVEWR
jgi:hypothetical protein